MRLLAGRAPGSLGGTFESLKRGQGCPSQRPVQMLPCLIKSKVILYCFLILSKQGYVKLSLNVLL